MNKIFCLCFIILLSKFAFSEENTEPEVLLSEQEIRQRTQARPYSSAFAQALAARYAPEDAILIDRGCGFQYQFTSISCRVRSHGSFPSLITLTNQRGHTMTISIQDNSPQHVIVRIIMPQLFGTSSTRERTMPFNDIFTAEAGEFIDDFLFEDESQNHGLGDLERIFDKADRSCHETNLNEIASLPNVCGS